MMITIIIMKLSSFNFVIQQITNTTKKMRELQILCDFSRNMILNIYTSWTLPSGKLSRLTVLRLSCESKYCNARLQSHAENCFHSPNH